MYPTDTHILIVDDSDTVRDLLRNELFSLGFKNVTTCVDGQDALTKLEANRVKSPVKLIISDWNMPKMSGLDLLKKLKIQPPFAGIPFILLTSEAEMANVWTAIEAGVVSYIVKPLAEGVLSKKLAEVYKKTGGK